MSTRRLDRDGRRVERREHGQLRSRRQEFEDALPGILHRPVSCYLGSAFAMLRLQEYSCVGAVIPGVAI